MMAGRAVVHASILIFLAGIFAGAQNALAGGGSFVTLGVLVFAGLDPRAANITSTVALFPGMVMTGAVSHRSAVGIGGLSLNRLIVISIIGGACGGALLLATPSTFFAKLVPWLVLFATAVFFWGSFLRTSAEPAPFLTPTAAAWAQFAIAIYGGYFGGGIGFLMLAVMTVAGMAVRGATFTKNVLAVAMNASAFLIFVASKDVHWTQAVALGAGSVIGGYLGVALLPRVNERALRIAIIVLGVALTVGLFVRGR
jgi:uncharacterized membrane protein YfcA